MTKRQREAWANRVYEEMREKGILGKQVQLVWLAGSHYRNHLSRLVSRHGQLDPLEHLRMGERLRWLKMQLRQRN
jgi:hypothetical protein